ncbi:NAD binding domain of 6-phosphogluconate dehydrogenase family protein [Candidatus Desulfosporosinus infrequens]|uniref:NAD binding domain of 6-phosphogluconate dehydrogenase family protein n=1 Tax=Candidatus Desulfosporosinus infrequens TaxID=2043169 RepID=A0A2U3LQT5_9FIRM|nr:NAD binding domain of 6-phosphogluconate dehydrogenase family protein [Candidatus Desulfosporosinus infrequens]
MKFGIIGAGIVGTALAVRLEEAGHECVGVHTRSRLSYERFRSYLMIDHLSLEELVPAADSLFITTQDSMIQTVAENLSTNVAIKPGQVWIHCSGSLASDVLHVKASLPIHCLSLHPLQAFASVEKALAILKGTHFGIEGDNQELGESIVKDLGGIPHPILAAQKSLYHAGAVVASNYLVVLASLAVELFTEAGIPEEEALASLLPLMRGTLYNLEQVGLPQALTGPIARGDAQVVQGHLDHMPANLVGIYQGLGLKALELGESKKAQQGLSYPPEELNLLKLLLNTLIPV